MWKRVRGTVVEDRPRYFDRGIICCERWESFDNFYADMGPRPPGHSIDRKDNDKGYSPDNCRWATSSQQARNRITSRIVSAFGLSLTLAEWAERTGIDYCVLWARISVLRWDPERAFMEGAKEVIWPSI